MVPPHPLCKDATNGMNEECGDILYEDLVTNRYLNFLFEFPRWISVTYYSTTDISRVVLWWWVDRVGQVLENYNALGMQFFSSFMVRSYQMKP